MKISTFIKIGPRYNPEKGTYPTGTLIQYLQTVEGVTDAIKVTGVHARARWGLVDVVARVEAASLQECESIKETIRKHPDVVYVE